MSKIYNISDLGHKVEVIGKKSICKNNQLESSDIELNKVKATVKVFYLPLQTFI